MISVQHFHTSLKCFLFVFVFNKKKVFNSLNKARISNVSFSYRPNSLVHCTKYQISTGKARVKKLLISTLYASTPLVSDIDWLIKNRNIQFLYANSNMLPCAGNELLHFHVYNKIAILPIIQTWHSKGRFSWTIDNIQHSRNNLRTVNKAGIQILLNC